MTIRTAIIAVLAVALFAVRPVARAQIPTDGTRVASVAVTGIDSTRAAALSELLLTRPGGMLNDGYLDHDTRVITDRLHDEGWWRAHVGRTVDGGADSTAVVFTVTPGTAVMRGTFTMTLTDGPPEPPGTAFPADGPSRLTLTAVDDAATAIVGWYADAGYPDVAVTPVFTARDDTVDVMLVVTHGARAHVDAVEVTGLTRTREDVVVRELRGLTGRAAGHEVLAEARAIIAELGFVGPDGDPWMRYDGARGVLVAAVREGRQGAFDGVIGYQPSRTGSGGEVIGMVDVAFDNIGGTGRAASARWEKSGTGMEDLALDYTEPRLLGRLFSVHTSFAQSERTLYGYTTTAASLALGRRLGRARLRAGLTYEKVSADSATSTGAAGGGISGIWSALDDAQNPSTGFRYSAGWTSLFKRPRFGGDSFRLDRTAISLDHYIPLRSRHVAAVLIRYRGLDAPRGMVGTADKYWLGGAGDIRGQREKSHPALTALWTNIEYRVLAGGASRVYLFCDWGWLVDRRRTGTGIERTVTTLTGYGFGAHLGSRAGTIGVDYGLGRGDSPGEGKLHVRLTTSF